MTTKTPVAANMKLEMEVKGTARLNKLTNPVANTNSFQYNQTPNPDLFETIEPYGYAEMDADYRVNEYPAIPGPAAGAYYWNSEIGAYGDWAIWQDLNYKAPGLVATSEGMAAKPGERWQATFQARYMDPAWINSYTTSPTWTMALGAYNGETYLSDVSTITVNLGTSYDAGWSVGAKQTAFVALTPANTTNVRWRIYNVTDLPAAGAKRLTLELRKGFSVARQFVSVPGWTPTSLEVTPVVAGWGYGPTVFEGRPVGTTGQLLRSNTVACVAGNYAGVATDFVSGTNATVRVGMEFLNASNAQVGTTTWSNTITGQTFKQRVGVAAVIPATATQVRMVIDPQDNKVFQWDAAVLVNDATTLVVAQQTGFKETSGFAVTNKIINPNGSTGTNGWTPASGIVTLTSENSGISLDFPVDSDSRVNPVNPIGAYSNIFDCNPGNWISAKVTVRGRGAARVRYEWLSATNVNVGYSEWSGVTYFVSSAVQYADTMVVPAGAFRARLHIQYGQAVAMWDGPFYAHFEPPFGDFSFTNAEALVGETMGGVTGTPNSDTVTWVNLFNSSTQIKINRGELDPGVLTAVIADSTYDPNVNISVRPDARVRCMALKNDGLTWAPLFTGELRDINVEYPYRKRALVSITAIDNIRTLNNESVNFGVPTLGALTHVMTGSDVPWTITSADATTNTKVNGEVTSRLDQIILTRDTQKGFAFVDKTNRLIVRDRATQTARATTVFFSDLTYSGDVKWNSYTPAGVEVRNSATDVINAMIVKVLTWNGTATVETESALFTNGTSINEWGRQQKNVTINGGTGAPTATTWATDVMNLHASPVPTVNKVSFPVYDNRAWDHAIDLELYDNCQVEYSPIQLNRTYAVRELTHEITPGRWTCEVSFRSGAGLATLLEVNLGS